MEIMDINMHKHIAHKLGKERDQYKAENEKLRERNKELEKRCNQKVRRYLRGGLQQMRIVDLESKYNDMKSERDTLIDDLKVLREKNEKLKEEMKRLHEESNITVFCALMEENSELKENNEQLNEIFNYQEKKKKEYFNEMVKLEQENKALRLQANTYFDEWQEAKKNYITLTYHIRLKASVNPGVSRYIALVNFIDKLERGEYAL